MSKTKPNKSLATSRIGIIRLLTEAGESGLGVQFLSRCETGASYSPKKGVTITFATESVASGELISGTRRMVGVVVWIPKEDFDRAADLIDAEPE